MTNIVAHKFGTVPQTVVKHFRFSPKKARQLRRLAKRSGVSETDVVRAGIDLVEEMEDRLAATEELIALIDGPEPKKINFGLR